jgi:GDP-4-dehydro-6-deoxy-D-mannose reductase
MSIDQKKVLIFGICGFVGRYLTKEFVNHGYLVDGSDICAECGVTEAGGYYPADLLDAESVKRVIVQSAPDMIVNLAAISSVAMSWGIPQKTMAVNVTGALNILEAARQCDHMPKVLFVGSSEEYAESEEPISEETPLQSNNPYGISKMAQERFAEVYRDRYGMKIYCVRPFNHTGVGQKDSFVLPSFCKQAAEIEKSGHEGVMRVGNLSAKRDFSNVRDVVRAYRMILESDDCRKIYNVGSGAAHSLQEMLDYIVSLSSQKITVETDPERFRPVDTPVICCDAGRIRRELGWSPQYDIFDTLKEIYEYYLAH